MKTAFAFLVGLTLVMFTSCEENNDSITFYWDETSCDNPWLRNGDESDEALKQVLEDYLADQNIDLISTDVEFNPAKAQVCLACYCTTGKVFVVEVAWFYQQQMKNLNFYQ